MRFSIIIPTHNRKETLRRSLSAAIVQDYLNYEVIVVDDGSSDGTGEMVRREFPHVRCIRQEPNRGPAAARNRGIEAATGEIIAFTDDDCLVPPTGSGRAVQLGRAEGPEGLDVDGPMSAPSTGRGLRRGRPKGSHRLEAWGGHPGS
jgi:glycosyltransferase involved in cell wall biosynthesis